MKLKYLHNDLHIHVSEYTLYARYASAVTPCRTLDLAVEHVKAGSVKANLQWQITNIFTSTSYHLFIHRFILISLYQFSQLSQYFTQFR
jgi:hypothetical protein